MHRMNGQTAAILFLSMALAGHPAAAGEGKGAPEKASASAADQVTTAKGKVTVIPIQHATFALQGGGKTVIVDPVGGEKPFAGLPKADLILLTDIHGDHLSAETVKALAGEKTVCVLPKAALEALLKADPSLEKLQTKVLANGETAKVEGIGIGAVPMYNTSPDRLKFHEKGRGNGYVLDLGGLRTYISGDTEDIPEMRKLKDIDLAFLCMNLPYTMTAEQAASAVIEFRPKVVYPYHSKGQDTGKFKALVEEKTKGVEVRLRDWYRKA